MEPIISDNHALSNYQDCPQKFCYRMVDGIVQKGGKASAKFGISLHAGREAYRKAIQQGVGHTGALSRAVTSATARWDVEMPIEYKQPHLAADKRSKSSLTTLLQGYLNKFSNQYYEPIHVEVPFAIHVGQSRLFPGRDVIATGIIDEVCRFNGGLYVLDLKSCGDLWGPTPNWFNQFRTSSQCMGYVRAAEETLGEKVCGVIIHAIWVKLPPGPRSKLSFQDYFRGDVFCYSTSQLDEWQSNFINSVDDCERAQKEGRWRRVLGTACTNYGGCAYQPLCSSPPETRAQLIKLDYEVERWVPLAEKRTQKDTPV